MLLCVRGCVVWIYVVIITFLFVLIGTHLPMKTYIIIDITDKIKFLTAFREKYSIFKDNFQQSSNACAAYSNVITSRNLLPITGMSIKDGVSLI